MGILTGLRSTASELISLQKPLDVLQFANISIADSSLSIRKHRHTLWQGARSWPGRIAVQRLQEVQCVCITWAGYKYLHWDYKL